MLYQRQHADEARGARRVGDAVDLAQQLVDVRVAVAVDAGVTGRVQAGCAVQRVDAQAGIVAQRGQSAGNAR